MRKLLHYVIVFAILFPNFLAHTEISEAACTNRYMILVGGWNSNSASLPVNTFNDIVSQVLPEFGYGNRIKYFSYNWPTSDSYQEGDTFNELPSSGPDSLRSGVSKILLECDGANIDLIGHSLGGVIITEFLGKYLGSNEVNHVKHVITLNSPIQGISYAQLQAFAAFVFFGQAFAMANGTSASLLAQRANNPELTVPVNLAVAKAVSKTAIVRTISSTSDLFVWRDFSRISGFDVTIDAGRTLQDVYGHSTILHQSAGLEAVRAALRTAPPATPQSPTPLPPSPPPQSTACTSNGQFVQGAENYKDGTILGAGVAFNKLWTFRNTGTCVWGSGYQLVFTGGDRLGGPDAISVPSTAKGATANIGPNLTTPTSPGKYKGYWRLRDPQGVYFGEVVWVQIEVKVSGGGSSGGGGTSPSGHITVFDVSPPPPSAARSVRLVGRIRYFPEFRSMRFVAGTQAFGEQANLKQIGDQLEISTDWDTSSLPRQAYAVALEVATKSDPNWTSAERQIINYTLTGTATPVGRPPDRPSLKDPYDWYLKDAAGSSTQVQLCVNGVSDPDGDAVQYFFEATSSITGSVTSGWQGSTCWSPTLPPATYSWRAKAGDGANESGWSQETWHFSVAEGNVSIGSPTVYQANDVDNTHICVPITYGGIQGPDVYAWINRAADGSDSGSWRLLDHYGPNTTPDCTQSNVHGWWIRSQRYITGPHLIRVSAIKPDSGASATMTFVHTIPFMRPAAPKAIAPSSFDVNGTWWNTPTIKFEWNADLEAEQPNPPLRTDSYRLRVSTSADPWSDPSPVLDVPNLPPGTTSYTHTFNQDYAKLYWSVRATNSAGSGDSGGNIWFGIDRVAPGCTIRALPATQSDSFFQVNWSGTDNAAGARIFDIQYQDSSRPGADWTDWLVNVPASKTFDLFNGQPGHSYAFRCRTTDAAGNVGSYPSTANTSTKIDPTSRPPTPWWNTAYATKRNITVLNNMSGTSLPSGYPMHLRFDGGTSPTAAEIYGASQSSQKCNDVRVVANDSLELDRLVQSCSSSVIDIWFSSQVTIAGAESNNTSHQLYYGNASAGSPPSDPTKVWPPLNDSNTVGLWYLSEGSGATSADASGRGNNITTLGTLSWADGKFGKALSHNDPNSGPPGASIPGSASLGSAAFTYEAFVKRGPFAYGHLGAQGQSNSGRERWMLRLVDGRLDLVVWTAGGVGSSDVSTDGNFLPDSAWHHVAVTFDGNRTVQFYRDGVLMKTGTLSQSGINSTNLDLFIGSGFQSSAERFYGLIDQVRLSNIVRTSFPHGQFVAIPNEPSLAAGAVVPRPEPVTGTPDLAVLAVTIYPNPDGGKLAEIIVQNQGARPTQNGFYTDLYINHQPTGAGDYTGSVSTWIASSIDPGQVITLTAVLPDVVQSNFLAAAADAPTEIGYSVYAQTDSSGALGSASQTSKTISPAVTVCTANADSFEGDDSRSAAKPISVNGAAQKHSFHAAGDQDWVSLSATAGVSYTITTANLAAVADTVLTLYGADGTTVLSTNDDDGNSLASRIVWQAPASGTYFIKVSGWSPNAGGCGTTYDLAAASQASLTLSVTKAGSGGGTVTSSDSKINCGSTCAVDYTSSDQVTLTATAGAGSVFSGWSGTCTGTGSCQVTMHTARTITATFSPAPPTSHALTVAKAGSGNGTVAGSGINCGATCQAQIAAGVQVTLTATPAPGANFGGWGGACSGAGPCVVTMDAAKSVTANFQSIPVGVVVGRPPGLPPSSGGPALIATLTARPGCGAIDHIQFGNTGIVFTNAKVSISSPTGGPSDQKSGFDYRPPANTTSVSLVIQRVVQNGGATVNPILFYDGCGEWRTFVGGGSEAFK